VAHITFSYISTSDSALSLWLPMALSFDLSNVSFNHDLWCGAEKFMERESHSKLRIKENVTLWDVKKEKVLLTSAGGRTAWNLGLVLSFCYIFHCIGLMQKLLVFPHLQRQ